MDFFAHDHHLDTLPVIRAISRDVCVSLRNIGILGSVAQRDTIESAGVLKALFGEFAKFTAARAIHENLGIAIFRCGPNPRYVKAAPGTDIPTISGTAYRIFHHDFHNTKTDI